MRCIYVMISQTGTSGSRFFKMITRRPYNHSSLSLDKEMREMYAFGRRWLYWQFVAGLVQEDPDTFVYKRFKRTRCKIMEIPVTEGQHDAVRRVIEQDFLPEMPRHKYDFLGLPFKSMGIDWPRPYRFVCSHFVAEVLVRAGVFTFSRPPFLVYPHHLEELLSLPGARVLYEGTLTGYKRGRFDSP